MGKLNDADCFFRIWGGLVRHDKWQQYEGGARQEESENIGSI